MAVRIGWTVFDAQAAESTADDAVQDADGKAAQALLKVSWAEFDAAAKVVELQVDWAEFDADAVVAPPPQPAKPKPPLYYAPGASLANYYNDSRMQFEIPLDVDIDDEDELLANLLIEIATYVF